MMFTHNYLTDFYTKDHFAPSNTHDLELQFYQIYENIQTVHAVLTKYEQKRIQHQAKGGTRKVENLRNR